ncbi:hypothetical protein VPH35_047277 [Triticum aestivum]|uniref:F-box domain-containing protein n=1 Tax=Triticum aestivum TaxID=4565 RepID=A0A3B6EPQ8_WHEAT
MAGDVDRLSDLPDELLLRVLRFVPAKQAAATPALSRRWRSPLYRSSGAMNLEMFDEGYEYDDDYNSRYGQDECKEAAKALFFSRRDAFVSAAVAVLDAADVPVTRLALRLEYSYLDSIWMFLDLDPDRYNGSPARDFYVLASLLSHPAARRVEELCLVDVEYDGSRGRIHDRQEGEVDVALSFGGLNLRLLDLANCCELVSPPPAAPVVFPRLSSLRMGHCTTGLDTLQSLIDAAPALADVCLESVVFAQHDDRCRPPQKALLRFPAATVLVLERCNWAQKDGPYYKYIEADKAAAAAIPVEIDAPRLRCFRYKGLLRPFSLSPRPPDLGHADLHFVPRGRDERGNKILRGDEFNFNMMSLGHGRGSKTGSRDLEPLWRFLGNFTGAKELKLRINPIEDMAVLSEARRAELLPAFPILERVELHGVHRPKGRTAAVAIGNLLRCCPALRDLRINLTAEHHYPKYLHDQDLFLESKFRADGDKCIHLRNRCRVSPNPAAVSPGGDDGDANYDEVSELPGLSQRSFDCLRSSLTRVGLQFRMEEEVDCLGVRLIKFFAENAMVLQEMFIDGGNGKPGEHITGKVERWVADSSCITRKPGASSFVVLPLVR